MKPDRRTEKAERDGDRGRMKARGKKKKKKRSAEEWELTGSENEEDRAGE